MSILGKIFGRIFPQAQAAQPPAAQAAPAGTAATSQPAGAGAVPGAPAQQGTVGAAQAAPAAAAAMERVDVEKLLDGMASQNSQKLNWRTSIVDLMKLLGLDSSLQERKELADELKYSGDKNDSATMNIWLHKQVMRKLEENGGKVPADLKD
ncbi:MAG: DUF3597 domain-containing protein [Ramlibacter sp.]|nr:DUF3597 domain-containing protein [Ramlibacter sp.]